MYQIVADTIASYNGLGAGGETFTNVMQALTPVISTAGQIAQTAINAKNNQNPNQATTYTGGNTYTPVVYQPTTTTTPTTTTEKKDWTPWLIGGAIAAVAGIYLITRK